MVKLLFWKMINKPLLKLMGETRSSQPDYKNGGSPRTSTWMSGWKLGSKVRISGLYNPNIYIYIPCISRWNNQPIDPNSPLIHPLPSNLDIQASSTTKSSDRHLGPIGFGLLDIRGASSTLDCLKGWSFFSESLGGWGSQDLDTWLGWAPHL